MKKNNNNKVQNTTLTFGWTPKPEPDKEKKD